MLGDLWYVDLLRSESITMDRPLLVHKIHKRADLDLNYWNQHLEKLIAANSRGADGRRI